MCVGVGVHGWVPTTNRSPSNTNISFNDTEIVRNFTAGNTHLGESCSGDKQVHAPVGLVGLVFRWTGLQEDLQMDWSLGGLVFSWTGLQVDWYLGGLVFRQLVFRWTGLQVDWSSGGSSGGLVFRWTDI